MKKIYLCILVLIFNISFSQIKSGEVVYRTILSDEKNDDIYRKMASKGASKLEFNLKFDTLKSYYKLIDKIENSDSNVKMALAFSGYLNPISYDQQSQKFLYYNPESPIFDKKEYLIELKDTIGWELTTDKKIINNYTCYRATSKRPIYFPKETKYFEISAWYCPEIPANFGPLDCAGLPGLILELHYQYISIVADKIFINNNIKTPCNTEGVIITDKKYRAIFNERMEEIKKEME